MGRTGLFDDGPLHPAQAQRGQPDNDHNSDGGRGLPGDRAEEIRRGIEIPLKDDGEVRFVPSTVVNGVAIAGTANNVNPVVRNNRMTRDES